jgi:hypothetical protein
LRPHFRRRKKLYAHRAGKIIWSVLCILKFKQRRSDSDRQRQRIRLGRRRLDKRHQPRHSCKPREQAGTVWVNDYLDSSAGNPFGGYKQSGIGREVHKMAMEHYTQVKNISIADTDFVPPVW